MDDNNIKRQLLQSSMYLILQKASFISIFFGFFRGPEGLYATIAVFLFITILPLFWKSKNFWVHSIFPYLISVCMIGLSSGTVVSYPDIKDTLPAGWDRWMKYTIRNSFLLTTKQKVMLIPGKIVYWLADKRVQVLTNKFIAWADKTKYSVSPGFHIDYETLFGFIAVIYAYAGIILIAALIFLLSWWRVFLASYIVYLVYAHRKKIQKEYRDRKQEEWMNEFWKQWYDGFKTQNKQRAYSSGPNTQNTKKTYTTRQNTQDKGRTYNTKQSTQNSRRSYTAKQNTQNKSRTYATRQNTQNTKKTDTTKQNPQKEKIGIIRVLNFHPDTHAENQHNSSGVH